ncbi:MAG: dihydroorotate dehydrogenase electron transfer subunit [Elusimicrobiota bacterium]|jgi:dihydroorotate dehydrogenase electron transfer subunit
MLDRRVKVKDVQSLGAANYLVTLRSPEQARRVKPGQFLMLKCGEEVDGNPLLRRPFSILDIDHHGRGGSPADIKILVKDVGFGTHKLVHVQPGQELFALGPQGRPFQLAKEMAGEVRTACLVAGGVGIAALYLLAKDLIALGVTPVLFYGARTARELVLRDYFKRLRIRTCYATEDGSMGTRGLVTAPLVRFLKEHHREGVRMYACGPWAMMRETDKLARQFSVPCEVSLEARMGCSLGACMGCVVRTRGDGSSANYIRVCMEGPVISSRLIDWDHPPL